MTPAAAETGWSDSRLVSECLEGNEHAWSALIDKYKNLIYSIPLKYGLSSDEAAEIFQSVCLSLLSELPKVREPKALPAWLIRVTYNRCFHWKREQQFVAIDDYAADPSPDEGAPKNPEDLIREIELEQNLREAVASLAPRCRRLVEMLFYESPSKPYEEIARSLGLAKGSIGFIRGRCLEQLRKKLEGAGFTG
jgi:RNA polymerase sigma factor (sigma-70 family)